MATSSVISFKGLRKNGEFNVWQFLFSMNPDIPAFQISIFTDDFK